MKIRKASVQLDTDEYIITPDLARAKGIELRADGNLMNKVCGVIMKIE